MDGSLLMIMFHFGVGFDRFISHPLLFNESLGLHAIRNFFSFFFLYVCSIRFVSNQIFGQCSTERVNVNDWPKNVILFFYFKETDLWKSQRRMLFLLLTTVDL